jgi:hypothetical protein
MRIGYDTSVANNGLLQLKSWKSDSDPSSRDYTISMDPRRLPGLLLSKGTDLKYRTGPWNGQGFNGQPYLKSMNNVVFNMTVREGSAYYFFTNSDTSVQWRTVLTPQGIANRWYRYSSSPDNGWVDFWHWPQSTCDSYAFCGPNAVCYNADCKCLPEFVQVSQSDWNRRNFTGGCKRSASFSCSSANGFQKFTLVKVPDTLNATLVRGKSLDECKELCLGNCSCNAYTVLEDSDCVVWSGDLVDTVQLADGINDFYTRTSHNDDPSHSGMFRSLFLSTQEFFTLLY